MNFERSWTGNWDNAFHGLRHPLESYAKSDSVFGLYEYYEIDNSEFCDSDFFDYEEGLADSCYINSGEHCAEIAVLGPNDIDLAQRMIKAGSPNDKFLRQIFVSVDITAPLYWWKEMDTYKVATVANSTSTMHKLASTPITLDCFEIDDYKEDLEVELEQKGMYQYNFNIRYMSSEIIKMCEALRIKYNSLMKKSKQDNLTEDERKAIVTEAKLYWKELIRWLPESWLQTRTWTANYATLRNIIHWRQGHKLTEWAQFIEWCHTLPYADELLFFDNK